MPLARSRGGLDDAVPPQVIAFYRMPQDVICMWAQSASWLSKSEIAALCVHKMFEDAGLPQEMDLRESGRETHAELGVKGGWQESMQPSCVGILG